MNVEIANNLVRLRKKNGLSQEDLAEKIGVSRQAVSKWERAESSPDTDNLIALAELYNLSLDDMIKGNNVEENTVSAVDNNNKDNRVSLLKLFPYPVFIVLVYLFIGLVWDLWSPGWLLFLTIPIWGAVVRYVTLRKKD